MSGTFDSGNVSQLPTWTLVPARLDTARSAIVATVWMTKKGRVIDNSGHLLPLPADPDLDQLACTLLSQYYGRSSNDTVWDQLTMLQVFMPLGTGTQDTPLVPEGNVTPAGCPQGQEKLSSSVTSLSLQADQH